MNTMTNDKLRDELALLHDAVLLSAEMQWQEAKIVLTVRTAKGLRRVVTDGAKRLECSRDLPWGPSHCINNIRIESASDGVRMEVEMQSGDVLVILGNSVTLAG